MLVWLLSTVYITLYTFYVWICAHNISLFSKEKTLKYCKTFIYFLFYWNSGCLFMKPWILKIPTAHERPSVLIHYEVKKKHNILNSEWTHNNVDVSNTSVQFYSSILLIAQIVVFFQGKLTYSFRNILNYISTSQTKRSPPEIALKVQAEKLQSRLVLGKLKCTLLHLLVWHFYSSKVTMWDVW